MITRAPHWISMVAIVVTQWSFVSAETAPATDRQPREADSLDAPAPVPNQVLEVSWGPALLTRRLDFTDDRFESLPGHSMPAVPALFARIEGRPLALVGGAPSLIRPITIVLEGVHSAALPTEGGGRSDVTVMRQWMAGLRLPTGLGPHELGISLSYAADDVDLRSQGAPSILPDVSIRSLRAGADVRLRFSSLLVGLGGGYRGVVSAGEIENEDWFPALQAGGTDFSVRIGASVLTDLEVALEVTMTRYFFRLHPDPEDTRAIAGQVAGGAVDQRQRVLLGCVWRLW